MLLTLRTLTGVDCADAKLAELAARMGSDIPFFIYRTAAVCRGRGEIIEPGEAERAAAGAAGASGLWGVDAVVLQDVCAESGAGRDGACVCGFRAAE